MSNIDTTVLGPMTQEEISHLEKVQSILMEILKEFDRLCKENSIEYSLAYGSMIGAARHKSIIPWDDDLDVCMKRSEYEKFKKVASQLREPFKFVSPQEMNGKFYDMIPRVYSLKEPVFNHTEDTASYNDISTFAWLDIFIIDKTYQGRKYKKQLRKNTIIYGKCLSKRSRLKLSRYNGFIEKAGVASLSFLGKFSSLKKLFEKAEKNCTKYENDPDADGWVIFNMENLHLIECVSREMFSSPTIEVDFGGMKAPIFANYDAILKWQFGDYMSFPPVEKRVPFHGNVDFSKKHSGQ